MNCNTNTNSTNKSNNFKMEANCPDRSNDIQISNIDSNNGNNKKTKPQRMRSNQSKNKGRNPASAVADNSDNNKDVDGSTILKQSNNDTTTKSKGQSKSSNNRYKKISKSSNNNDNNNLNGDNNTAIKVARNDAIHYCTICSNKIKYCAVGECNHHICSICCLRLRVKSNDFNCPICKKLLCIMIISKQTKVLKLFSSFNIIRLNEIINYNNNNNDNFINNEEYISLLSQVSLVNGKDANNNSKVELDIPSLLLCYQCVEHAVELRETRSIVCPLLKCKDGNNKRRQIFASHSALFRHLKEFHNKERLHMCQLCIDNRSLFMNEQSVFNKKQLDKHLYGWNYSSGKVTARVVDGSPPDNHNTGHPLCPFCNIHFFDRTALYQHLNSNHFTCHLCPRSLMFRYYRDSNTVRTHHYEDHFVCAICEAHANASGNSGDVDVAFRNAVEYAQHMQSYHNQNTNLLKLNNNRFRLGTRSIQDNRNFYDNNNNLLIYDMDMGSASSIDDSRDIDSSINTSGSSTIADRMLTIPPHMRIAGRVSGTGIFQPLSEEDIAIQRLADEANEAANSLLPQYRYATVHDTAFPVLTHINENTDTGGVQTTDNSKSIEPHPLSVMHASRKGTSLEAKRQLALKKQLENQKLEKEREDKRIERNMRLAEALFGDTTDTSTNAATNNDSSSTPKVIGDINPKTSTSTVAASDVGATLRHRGFTENLTRPLLSLCGPNWNEKLLLRPLYPPQLIAWAVSNPIEVVKIERKLYNLFNNVECNGNTLATNSINLKPMNRPKRQLMHQWAAVHLLNSYEYDYEPQRYVSFVKQIDSYLPLCALSTATTLTAYLLPDPLDATEPVILSGRLSVQPSVLEAAKNKYYEPVLDWERIKCVKTAPVVASKQVPIIFLSLTIKALTIDSNQTTTSSSRSGPRFAFTIAEIVNRINILLNNATLWQLWTTYLLSKELESYEEQLMFSECQQSDNSNELTVNSFNTPELLLSTMDEREARERLSKLSVPQIRYLIPAGPSAIGIQFGDMNQAQLALRFLYFCIVVIDAAFSSPTWSTHIFKEMKEAVEQSTIKLLVNPISRKFNIHPAFIPQALGEMLTTGRWSAPGAKDLQHSGHPELSYFYNSQGKQKDTEVRRVDPRHFESNDTRHGDEWQFVTLKSKAIPESSRTNVGGASVTHIEKETKNEEKEMKIAVDASLAEEWDDCCGDNSIIGNHLCSDIVDDENNNATTSSVAASDNSQKDSDWENFLQSRRNRNPVAVTDTAEQSDESGLIHKKEGNRESNTYYQPKKFHAVLPPGLHSYAKHDTTEMPSTLNDADSRTDNHANDVETSAVAEINNEIYFEPLNNNNIEYTAIAVPVDESTASNYDAEGATTATSNNNNNRGMCNSFKALMLEDAEGDNESIDSY